MQQVVHGNAKKVLSPLKGDENIEQYFINLYTRTGQTSNVSFLHTKDVVNKMRKRIQQKEKILKQEKIIQ